jgi:thiamine-monophosphate kinase
VSGEFDLIAKLRDLAEAGGAAGREGERVALASGDDAAVTVPSGATATSVDAIVDGIHFHRERTPPQSVGRKALCSALSDLAAMGARPGEAYAIVGVPPEIGEDELLEVGAGLVDAAAEHGVAILGGDVTRAPALWLGITVVGHARDAADLVTRAGAAPGEALVLTGDLGAAAAGLLILERPELGDGIDPELAAALRERQLDPTPRLEAGLALASAGATAMIDVSDGLGADAGHLAAASEVRLEINLERLPVAAAVAAVGATAGVDPLELATAGGEDYELLASVPSERVAAAVAAVGETELALTPVGRVATGRGVSLRDAAGRELRPRGFDQLARRPTSGGPD